MIMTGSWTGTVIGMNALEKRSEKTEKDRKRPKLPEKGTESD